MWSVRKRSFGQDIGLASALVAVGLTMAGLSLRQMRSGAEMAQATPPLQGQPSDDTTNRDAAPAEAKPGGDRPTTPAPEPARPDPQTQGKARPALPQAPAEKYAPPIQQK